MKSWVSRLAPLLGVVWVATLAPGSVADALAPGDKPPAIDLPDQTGALVDLDALRGNVVLVDFWASWCGPCKQEMPILEALHKKYAGNGLVIVGVNIDKQQKKMANFLEAHPVTFRQVRDKKLEVASRYQPPTMPTSFLIDRTGTIRVVHEGFQKKDAAKIEAEIKKLLAETAPR